MKASTVLPNDGQEIFSLGFLGRFHCVWLNNEAKTHCASTRMRACTHTHTFPVKFFFILGSLRLGDCDRILPLSPRPFTPVCFPPLPNW